MPPDNQLGRRFLNALTVLEKELVQRAQLVAGVVMRMRLFLEVC